MTNRSCTRCGRPLEDAASMEAGIGPVCRKMDNAVLAHTFPADVDKARYLLEERGWNNFPEALKPKMAEVEADIYAVGHSGDWRTVIKRIEYLLSFEETQVWRNTLTEVVAALGYVGLAAIWTGDASTGNAEAFFAADTVSPSRYRLYVSGSRNPSFRYAIKRVKGWRYDPSGIKGTVDKPVWSIPADLHEDFLRLVMTYYPRCSNILQVIQEAKAFCNANAPVQTGDMDMARQSKVCRIEQHTEAGKAPRYRVFTPFNAHFINDLKNAVPYSMRFWNPQLKCWEIAATSLATVQTLIESHYGQVASLPADASNTTPVTTAEPMATRTKGSKSLEYVAPVGLPF